MERPRWISLCPLSICFSMDNAWNVLWIHNRLAFKV
jgi:hypothetical protein